MVVSKKLRSAVVRCLGGTIGLLFVFTLGCGGEKETNQTVTPPPLNTQSADNPTGETPSSEPPGTMEMPSEVDPNPSPADSKPGSSLEMPSTSGASSAPTPVDVAVSDASAEVLVASWDEVAQMAMSAKKVTVVDIWSIT